MQEIKNYILPRKSAILVIDMQNDFCHPQGHFGKKNFDITFINEMVPRLKWFVDTARNLGLVIFHIKSYLDEEFLTPPMIARNKQLGRERGICLKGSWGAEFYQILPAENDVVLVKHTYNAFIGTDLQISLLEKGIQSLMLTGVLTNVCCESTLRHGFMLGFYTFLIEDCCASTDEAAHLATVNNVRKYFGWVFKSQDAINCLREARA